MKQLPLLPNTMCYVHEIRVTGHGYNEVRVAIALENNSRNEALAREKAIKAASKYLEPRSESARFSTKYCEGYWTLNPDKVKVSLNPERRIHERHNHYFYFFYLWEEVEVEEEKRMDNHHFVTEKKMDEARDAFQNAFATYTQMLTNPSDRLMIYEFANVQQLALFQRLAKQLEQIKPMEEAIKERNNLCKAITLGLTRPRCTGRISGRYAIHKTNQCCPLHGEPPDGGRLRNSISIQDMEGVEIAISNYEKLRELAKSVYRLERQINSLRRDFDFAPLEPFYSTLPMELK